jgi:uncharacterized membrane protein HdeD (DUF308 family)
MKKLYFVIGGLLLLLGLVMLFAPLSFISALVACTGIIAVVNGIINLFSVRNLLDDAGFQRAFTLRAILNIVVGLAAVTVPVFFAGLVWTVIIYVLAAQLVLSAIIGLYGICKMHQAKLPYGTHLAEAIVSLLLAAVLFAIPASIGLILIRLMGVLIVIAGIGSIIWNLPGEKKDSGNGEPATES